MSRLGGWRWWALAVAIGLVATVGVAWGATGRESNRRPEPPARLASARLEYYLALGASEAVGFQPGPHGRGERTDQGYANDLTAMERDRFAGLSLVDLGCPGITATVAFFGGGRCGYPAGSEIRQAELFIREHRSSTVLVTVDLGFNDLLPCLRKNVINQPCVGLALKRLSAVLPPIVAAIRAAGGPDLQVVGVEHNDPYLGDYLAGGSKRAFAEASLGVVSRLNAVLSSAYTQAGVLAADVPAAFATDDYLMVPLPGHGLVPADVATICQLSWMCGGQRARPNIHPNAAGYKVIAKALAAALANQPTASTRPSDGG